MYVLDENNLCTHGEAVAAQAGGGALPCDERGGGGRQAGELEQHGDAPVEDGPRDDDRHHARGVQLDRVVRRVDGLKGGGQGQGRGFVAG